MNGVDLKVESEIINIKEKATPRIRPGKHVPDQKARFGPN